jgi:hypothetical protein
MLSLFVMIPILTINPIFSSEFRTNTFPPGTVPVRLEVPDDDYIAVPRESQPTSPATRYSSQDFFFSQVNVDFSGENIVGDAANEPSIAVDPTDPDKVAIGWRQFDTIISSFRQAGWGHTTDGGQTWTFPGVIEPGVFRSDPVLDFDSQGNFYYNSLTVLDDDFWCDVFKSTDGGATWDTGTFAQGGDKQWMTIDRSGGIGDGHHYAYWSIWWSICYPGYFTRSTDRGASYEDCDSIPTVMYWGTLNVGPDGELYACGAGFEDFVVAKSTNANDSSQSVAWDFVTSVDLDGEIWSGTGPNPGGLLGQAWVATDHSSGPTRGNVYLLCSVKQTSSPYDSLDVMFSRSTDGGSTWSAPVRVNDDPAVDAWQWFGTMSVAPDGRIDAIWLDTRNDPGGYDSELYYSYSFDAGATWSTNERLSESFDPHLGWPMQNKMGDYFDMVSDSLGFHLAWAATFNGEQDVYYGRYHGHHPSGIGDDDGGTRIPRSLALAQNHPNPFNPSTTISFEIPGTPGTKQGVNLAVYDLRGRRIRTLVDSALEPGSHRIHWDGRNDRGEPAPSGIFLYRLKSGGVDHTRKMVLLK